MEWYLKVVRDNYANFHGRASRKEYWMFVLFNFIFSIVAVAIDVILGLGFIFFIYTIGVLIPGMAVTIRRLHDHGKSGWWIFINFIPLIGAIWLLILLASTGSPEDNKFGASLETVQVTTE